MYQVRLHGRGGQGVVTAAELVASAATAERIGRPLPNAAMVGAFAATGIVSFASVREAIAARFHGRVAETNSQAAADAYERVLRGGDRDEPRVAEDREAESV